MQKCTLAIFQRFGGGCENPIFFVHNIRFGYPKGYRLNTPDLLRLLIQLFVFSVIQDRCKRSP